MLFWQYFHKVKKSTSPLQIDGANALPGNVTNNGTLDFEQIAGSTDIYLGSITGGNIVINSNTANTGTVLFSGFNTPINTFIQNGKLQLTNPGNLTGLITNNATLDLEGTGIFSGRFTGGNLVMNSTGPATITLQNVNTPAQTKIEQGIVILPNANNLAGSIINNGTIKFPNSGTFLIKAEQDKSFFKKIPVPLAEQQTS